jgi:hypothetical protein
MSILSMYIDAALIHRALTTCTASAPARIIFDYIQAGENTRVAEIMEASILL